MAETTRVETLAREDPHRSPDGRLRLSRLQRSALPDTTNHSTGWKLLIKPNRASLAKIREKLRTVWFGLNGQNAKAAVKMLNPVVRGWANYFRIAVASQYFSRLDRWMMKRAIRYARRNHPKKPAYWMKARYFGRLNPKRTDSWVFGDKASGMHLLKFAWFKIERHVLVRGIGITR